MKFEMHLTHTRYFTVTVEASSKKEAHSYLRERLAWAGLSRRGGEPEIVEDSENQYDFQVIESLTKQITTD